MNTLRITDFIAIDTRSHLCLGLRADGTVSAWGSFKGEGRAYVPEGLKGVKGIAAGNEHCLAVLKNGTVTAWGVDRFSQLDVPEGLEDVTAVAAGNGFSLAMKGDGTVVAWGDNTAGNCDVPADLANVVAIGVGPYPGHSVAVKLDGTVAAWGANREPPKGLDRLCHVETIQRSGMLRQRGRIVDLQGVPIEAPPSKGKPGISQSGTAELIDTSNDIFLWSDGTVTVPEHHWQPTLGAVPDNLNSVIAISSGDAHALALRADGSLVAWGDNSLGQLDLPALQEYEIPKTDMPGADRIESSNISSSRRFVALSAGWYHSAALTEGGTVVAWGRNDRGQCDIPPGLTGVVSIASGKAHSIALRSDGTVETWGGSVGGPIEQPPGLFEVTAIAAGEDMNLALKKDGSLTLWRHSYSRPIELPSEWRDIVSASFGGSTPMALRSDGEVLVGSGVYGIVPPPPGLWGVVSVAASYSTAYALTRSGSVIRWPSEKSSLFALPGSEIDFPDLINVSTLVAGWRHAVAIQHDGTLISWGCNRFQQSIPPVTLGAVKSVSLGESHTLALTADGQVVAWGSNKYGQLDVPHQQDGEEMADGTIDLDLVFLTRQVRNGVREWVFRLYGHDEEVAMQVQGRRFEVVSIEDMPGFGDLGEDAYVPMIYRIMEGYLPSFAWNGDTRISVRPKDLGEWSIVLESRVRVRSLDLANLPVLSEDV